MIQRDAKYIKDGISAAFVLGCLKEHEADLPRLKKLEDAYRSKPPISTRKVPHGFSNHKLIHNYARYIVAIASGYLTGNPVSYAHENKNAMEDLLAEYKAAGVDSVDAELAKDASLYGKAVELCYADENAAPRVATLEPLQAFVVYTNDISQRALCGIRYYASAAEDGRIEGHVVEVYTDNKAHVFKGKTLDGALRSTPEESPHYFGGVPIIEYWNNDDETGDFEHVLSLINAHDLLQSDRLNDKEQFVQSLLVLTGGRMEPDELNEDGSVKRAGRSAQQQIREDRMIILPDSEMKAEYLMKQLSEADATILSQEIKENIHKFAMVPDLTDSQFAGNVTGVAMKFKLFGLEQLTKIKERWFREALKTRLKLFIHFLRVKAVSVPDADEIDIVFKRTLPANELELAQMVAMLSANVPNRVLLEQLPFIDDAHAAIEELKDERQEAVKLNQEAFGMPLTERTESE